MKNLAMSELITIGGGTSPSNSEQGTNDGNLPIKPSWIFNPNDPRNQPWPRMSPRVE